ncbi:MULTISPECIES: AAA family ATPase [unclassified Candidatus Frackibacter]|uniref:AAA family ATPase n=1 Tax=unclassified Candidatus Frackibacter TaxID=2648818 RepID=UPI00088DBF44|nr:MULTISPECIES: AAA family ATPase [unclassified Candidatus Frackibacter]SDC07935.1 PD-(D/E)XK nuclease superfamily protein [Candidatus Frackibacter sp. WG11]SEM38569.1 PD-(D/E)XK nuclease superfamily protein [Candidatus Frackibacter sp. WG12]SFL44243.1 PD-(D/E)XK nuclease superfamily protein [Candidatus Frackibacter sp. WG13]
MLKDGLKGLPIGIDDFKDLRENNGYFVDKSLFIKEIIDDISKVKLITRPRRFGKTLNLSMLRYFFEDGEEDNSELFQDLEIWQQGEEYRSEQGKYPVVNLTFKDVKFANFDLCYQKLIIQISNEYKKHDYLLESDKIRDIDKKIYNSIISEKASYVRFASSLEFLTKLLAEYHDENVIVLIDEYDTPINAGYLNDYYEDIIDFMRAFLAGGLKGNRYLKTAVITGIYRVAKESIFSGFNNLEVCSVIDNIFTEEFGFIEKEVKDLLAYYNQEESIDEIRDWYNGYIFGDETVIYNPWSILNYLKYGNLKPYWVNTSSNSIIRQMLGKTGKSFKEKLQLLLSGKEIEDVRINTDTNFRDIQDRSVINESVLWNLLLVSGYLKPVGLHYNSFGDAICDLKIPNKEIRKLYRDIIMDWFEEGEVGTEQIREMLEDLVNGDIDDFAEKFSYLVRRTFSYFDVGYNAAENFYHAFILGLLVNLQKKYRIKSNAESGDGRPDVLIIPEDKSKRGVVIEFKVAKSSEEEVMTKTAEEALAQIEKTNYEDELLFSGIDEVLKVAVVLCGKKVLVVDRE